MAKKGVFGMKATPLDHEPKGTKEPAGEKQPEPQKEVHMEQAHSGGYIVHTMPGKHGAHRHTHVASTLAEAIGVANDHMQAGQAASVQ